MSCAVKCTLKTSWHNFKMTLKPHAWLPPLLHFHQVTFLCCWSSANKWASVTALPQTNNTRLPLDLMPLLICLPWSNRPHHWRNLSPECVLRVLSYNSTQSLHLSERALTVSLISLVVTKELSCGNREHQSIHEGMCFHNAADTASRNMPIRRRVKLHPTMRSNDLFG